jgi:Glycosyltransferase
MALGVPPVAFNVGGLPEVVENNASGLLVPAGDIAAFADAARRLMEDVALRGKLGRAARARSREFGADRMTEQTEMVYQGVISG